MQGEPTGCPYREICECLGGEEYEPIKGCILGEGGVVCLDWDIVIPLEDIPRVRIPEGRHITDAVESADKIDQAQKKYNRSPKRRAAQRRYEGKEKGQEALGKYQDTEKFRLAQQKYYYTDKGQEAHQRRRGTLKDFRRIQRWLQEHPGKTYEDYTREV